MSQSKRVICRVKWFNNKSGFGFATVMDESNTDVFVHHTQISVTDEQYKYLVQGEYVELTLNELTAGAHKLEAVDITGVNGGPLMCETRLQSKNEHEEYKTVNRSGNSSHTAAPSPLA